ncbi:glycosyltransferase family 4 protein [Pseudomonas sp. WS 5051]|uniref:glycosyltransferase family 4 protein n=1 Tax=Pseudomonas sp. WS 5051 TaxID=2717482 RepID=UPI0014753349|nr:glycosyltransferase family 4 protein [Pseudomonas sp. WS 5051]NMY55468.1 glycosyltransferase family 4 protein [Pseudomonas sp. WS 5051]
MINSIALVGTVASCVTGFRRDLIKYLVGKDITVYAFALDYDDASKAEVKKLGAVPVDYTLSRSGLNPFKDISDTIKLSRTLRSIKPDLVFCYFSKPVIFGTLAAKLAGVKRRIGMLEGLGYAFTEQPHAVKLKTKILKNVQVILYKISMPFLERLILLNGDDKKDLVDAYGINVKNVDIIGGIGLDLTSYQYSEPPQTPVVFVFVGRLLAEKGIHEFVKAAELVREKYTDSRFLVLGGIDIANPGALTEDALDHAIKSGLITYPGHVNNVIEWLHTSSVFVLPSYREGVPRSTQEAMAIGRAVITSDVPGCRDTVVDGVNGFLTTPWSTLDLYEKMEKFMIDRKLIVTMGVESREMAMRDFDVNSVNDKIYGFLS